MLGLIYSVRAVTIANRVEKEIYYRQVKAIDKKLFSDEKSGYINKLESMGNLVAKYEKVSYENFNAAASILRKVLVRKSIIMDEDVDRLMDVQKKLNTLIRNWDGLKSKQGEYIGVFNDAVIEIVCILKKGDYEI